MTLDPSSTSTVLEGQRVLLRPVRREDAQAAFRLVHDRPEILRWLLWRGPLEVSELEESFASWSAAAHLAADSGGGEGDDCLFAVIDRSDASFVGTIAARFSGHPKMGDLGYWLGEHVWGRGFATEAIGMLTDYCFERLGSHSLFAWVFVGNEGSRCALERNGFTLVRTELQRVEQDGIARDEWYFTQLRSEWLRRTGR